MDLGEIGWGGRDWIELAQDRDQWRALVNTVMNLRFLKNVGKFLSGCTIGSFSGRAQLRKLVRDLDGFANVIRRLFAVRNCDTFSYQVQKLMLSRNL
jgi:hypothetical protein